ncbi:MAG: hypothetical protein BIFFINMI_00066 [Phycisphaerae bacterium]|nr:hypothetical protein [Phycisphaerae bacterium]
MCDWKALWERGTEYATYVEDPEHGPRWGRVYDACTLTAAHRHALSTFTREMRLLTLSGIWCGDCVAQVPLIQRLSEASPLLEHRLLPIEQADEAFKERWSINGGHRVPVLFLLSSDFRLGSAWGDRTLGRYRLLRHAKSQMPPEADKKEYYRRVGERSLRPDVIAKTTDELLDEIERVQIMFQISPRLTELAAQAAAR